MCVIAKSNRLQRVNKEIFKFLIHKGGGGSSLSFKGTG